MKIRLKKVVRFVGSFQGLQTWISVTAGLQLVALLLGADFPLVICGGFLASFLTWGALKLVEKRFFPLTHEEERERARRLYGHRAPYSGLFPTSESDDDSDGQEE